MDMRRKNYLSPQADVVVMLENDIVTASAGEEHGMEVPVVPDENWQVDEIGEIGEIGGV